MVDTYIDGLSVEELCDRYGLGKAAFYDRKNALNLEFKKPPGSRKVVADASQISLLDELDGYIKSGGQLTQFAINQGIERSGELSAIQFARPSTDQPSDLSAQGMAILADAIATRLAPQNKITELRDRINLLDELCDRKIAIPTSDVAMLAGRTASGTAIHVYGFKIVKTTRKQSRQMLWRIYRDVELSDSLPECN